MKIRNLEEIKVAVKVETLKNNMEKLPKFVWFHGTALRLRGKEYYRDGGAWSVGCKIIDGVLLSWFPNRGAPWLHRQPLIEITEDEWRKDNGHYAPTVV